MNNNTMPVVIGLAGGTGSGKTTIANVILDRVGAESIAFLPHDAYYKDLIHLPKAQRELINFDHPHSLESELLVQHLRRLREWKVAPQPIVLVEGILIFAEPILRDTFDVKIFVDTPPDIRFIRRLERDIEERGRSLESVIQQYQTTVRPMHLEFVEPSKRYADVIIPEGGLNTVAMDMIVARIDSMLANKSSTKEKNSL